MGTRSVHAHVDDARARLQRAGLDSQAASTDAEVLARSALGWSRATYLTRGRDPAPLGFARCFDALLGRRAGREPVSLIIGRREFWNLGFEVTPDVLTPRPESELLVEETVAELSALGIDEPLVADVGTGSGCVAVAVAREVPGARIVATDVSRPALAVARRNAVRHGVSTRIEWRETSCLEGLPIPPDLVAGNLPYVPTSELATLAAEVSQFEPVLALDGGPDGLDVIRVVLGQAVAGLPRGRRVLLEIGAGQALAVASLVAESARLCLVRTRDDLQGIPRVVVIEVVDA